MIFSKRIVFCSFNNVIRTRLYEFLDILLVQYMKKIVKKNET